MNSSDRAAGAGAKDRSVPQSDAILAAEAGRPFRPPLHDDPASDPIEEWISLMEVVQMLCPQWPVRDKPLSGQHWKL